MTVLIFSAPPPSAKRAGDYEAAIEQGGTGVGSALAHGVRQQATSQVSYVTDAHGQPMTEPTTLVIDPSLGFTGHDLPDDLSFGNGCSVGSVRLRDGTTKACAWIVVAHADQARFLSQRATITRLLQA